RRAPEGDEIRVAGARDESPLAVHHGDVDAMAGFDEGAAPGFDKHGAAKYMETGLHGGLTPGWRPGFVKPGVHGRTDPGRQPGVHESGPARLPVAAARAIVRAPCASLLCWSWCHTARSS